MSDGQVELIALSIAAPVYGPTDEVVAALSVVVPTGGPPGSFIPVVRAAARGVSRTLGAPRTRPSR